MINDGKPQSTVIKLSLPGHERWLDIKTDARHLHLASTPIYGYVCMQPLSPFDACALWHRRLRFQYCHDTIKGTRPEDAEVSAILQAPSQLDAEIVFTAAASSSITPQLSHQDFNMEGHSNH